MSEHTEQQVPVCTGNAAIDGEAHRGWVVGHFMETGDLRHSQDVEIKWGIHPAGDERAAWQVTEHRTAVVILVSGRFTVRFESGPVELKAQGDYVMSGPGVGHSWRAEEDSVILTIRWPSRST